MKASSSSYFQPLKNCWLNVIVKNELSRKEIVTTMLMIKRFNYFQEIVDWRKYVKPRLQLWWHPILFTIAVPLQFFFLSGFSFTNIHDSQDGRGRGRLFLQLLSITSTCRYLDISWVITAESSPLHIASSRTRTRNL